MYIHIDMCRYIYFFVGVGILLGYPKNSSTTHRVARTFQVNGWSAVLSPWR